MLRHTGSRFPCRWTEDYTWVAGGWMPDTRDFRLLFRCNRPQGGWVLMIDTDRFYYLTTSEAIAWAAERGEDISDKLEAKPAIPQHWTPRQVMDYYAANDLRPGEYYVRIPEGGSIE